MEVLQSNASGDRNIKSAECVWSGKPKSLFFNLQNGSKSDGMFSHNLWKDLLNHL